jgi:hypothetical protein
MNCQNRRLAMRHRTSSTHVAAPDPYSLDSTEQSVRERAYQLYEERGCEHGHDLDDWIRAEAEILGELPEKKPSDSVMAHEEAAMNAVAV